MTIYQMRLTEHDSSQSYVGAVEQLADLEEYIQAETGRYYNLATLHDADKYCTILDSHLEAGLSKPMAILLTEQEMGL